MWGWDGWFASMMANFVGTILAVPVLYFLGRSLYDQLIALRVSCELEFDDALNFNSTQHHARIRIANLSTQPIFDVYTVAGVADRIGPGEVTPVDNIMSAEWRVLAPGQVVYTEKESWNDELRSLAEAEVTYRTTRGTHWRQDLLNRQRRPRKEWPTWRSRTWPLQDFLRR